MACCLPTCAQGSSVSATELVGKGAAWGLLVLLVVLLILGVSALLIFPLVCVWNLVAGHALRAEVGEGIVFVVLWEFTR